MPSADISDGFLTWWLIMTVTAILAGLTGLFLSQRLNSVVAIYITIPILLIPQILLCGLVVSFSDLTPNSTTGNVPVIGNVIPSRWAYEALAVTTYTDNEYEKDYFDLDREKFERQYYRLGFIEELQSAAETIEDRRNRGEGGASCKYMRLLKTELLSIATVCDLKPYNGKYDYALTT